MPVLLASVEFDTETTMSSKTFDRMMTVASFLVSVAALVVTVVTALR